MLTCEIDCSNDAMPFLDQQICFKVILIGMHCQCKDFLHDQWTVMAGSLNVSDFNYKYLKSHIYGWSCLHDSVKIIYYTDIVFKLKSYV